MTLPAAFPLSMSQIANELGLGFPLAFSHPWILALAQKSGFPMSFSDLLGKTGRFDGSLACSSNSISFGSAPFFGAQLNGLNQAFFPSAGTTLSFLSSPNWSGNILVRNNTTGVSIALPKFNATTWFIASAPVNLTRNGQTDSFTVLPSN